MQDKVPPYLPFESKRERERERERKRERKRERETERQRERGNENGVIHLERQNDQTLTARGR